MVDLSQLTCVNVDASRVDRDEFWRDIEATRRLYLDPVEVDKVIRALIAYRVVVETNESSRGKRCTLEQAVWASAELSRLLTNEVLARGYGAANLIRISLDVKASIG